MRKWRQSALASHGSLEEELADVGLDFSRWWRCRRGEARLYAEIPDTALRALAGRMPERARRAIAGAEQILAHRFDLLGSGPFIPADPDRGKGPTGYQPIDWYLDPVRRVRFPRAVPVKKWKLYEMRPKDGDIKYPWELGRCQHFATLGQAYRLTAEARFAQEVLDEVEDFMTANPVGIGVNWTCTMDVAIRAANWALGLALVKDCKEIAEERFASAYSALFEHGRYIFGHLENTYEVTSNHFLSNVVGLHFIASEFRETANAGQWDAFCRKALETEMNVQVLPDGADFESSVPYHRLVTELFMGSGHLATLQGRSLSEAYYARLADMVAYLAGVMRPDGLMPQLGDADDGRLHVFTGYPDWIRQDARHIFAPAGHLLGNDEWLALAGPDGGWETAWWGHPLAQTSVSAAAPSAHVRLYPDAGAFVARRGGHYLLVTNAKVGTKGFGNHKHNDQLSFELHIAGRPLIADPGSYVYTSDFAARNTFRSTAAHSTLSIDGTEQNEFNPEWLFRMFEKADAEHVESGALGDIAFYAGRHTGYRRLEQPVTHTRRFDFDLASGRLAISDRLTGTGTHDLVWRFQIAPGIGVTLGKEGHAMFEAGSTLAAQLRYPERLVASVEPAWYSPSYGVRVPSRALVLSTRCDVAVSADWPFAIEPLDHDCSSPHQSDA